MRCCAWSMRRCSRSSSAYGCGRRDGNGITSKTKITTFLKEEPHEHTNGCNTNSWVVHAANAAPDHGSRISDQCVVFCARPYFRWAEWIEPGAYDSCAAYCRDRGHPLALGARTWRTVQRA